MKLIKKQNSIVIMMISVIFLSSCTSRSREKRIREAVRKEAKANMNKIVKPYAVYTKAVITFEEKSKVSDLRSIIKINEDAITVENNGGTIKYFVLDKPIYKEDDNGNMMALFDLMDIDGNKLNLVTSDGFVLISGKDWDVLFHNE